MPIGTRKEIPGFGIPLERRKQLAIGDQVIAKAPFPHLGTEIKLTALKGDRVAVRAESAFGRGEMILTTAQLGEEGIILPSRTRLARISVKIVEKK